MILLQKEDVSGVMIQQDKQKWLIDIKFFKPKNYNILNWIFDFAHSLIYYRLIIFGLSIILYKVNKNIYNQIKGK